MLARKKGTETARRLAGAASERRDPLVSVIEPPVDDSSADDPVQRVIAPGKRWRANSVSALVGQPSEEARSRAERSSKALQDSEGEARRKSSVLGRH